MKKIGNIIKNYLSSIYIGILLIYILVSNMLILYKEYTLLDLSTTMIYFGIVGIVIYILSKIINKIKFDVYDLFILLLIILGGLSTIYAFDTNAALYGFPGRYEGLYQLILYYILFLNCKNIDNKDCKNSIVCLIISIGVLQAIYGIIQFVDIKKIFDLDIIRNRFYSTGFEMNPNFLGSLMIIALSLSLGIYTFNKKKIIVWLTFISSIVLFFGLLCSGAMSVTVSLFFVIILLIGLIFILKVELRKILLRGIVLFIGFMGVYFIFNKYDNGYYLSQVNKTTHEIGSTLAGNVKDMYGTGRIYIWKETLKVVPDNLVTGIGIDNFYYAFGKGPLVDLKSNLVVDKAHNEYLQKLITEGLMSLIVYLILLLTVFIRSIIMIIKDRKNRVSYLLVGCFLAFCAYCIQAFFNISVISVAPYFYIVMGLVCSFCVGGNNEGNEY